MKSLLELSERDTDFRDRRRDPYNQPPRGGFWATFTHAAIPVLLCALFVVTLGIGHRVTRPDPVRATLDRIVTALRYYRHLEGAYPHGDGTGSAEAARALARKGPRMMYSLEGVATDDDGNWTLPGGQRILYQFALIDDRWVVKLWTTGPEANDGRAWLADVR